MKYYSTNHKVEEISFEEAIFKGLPEDNGLYMPERIPILDETVIQRLPEMTLPGIAAEVIYPYVEGEISQEELNRITEEVFNFEIPVVEVSQNIYSLELFHGPTCAFKDVGARFMSRALGYFAEKKGNKATILVATSGDTGSAVANGFYGVPNINVIILYPSGKVSDVQEKQLTTLGKNITALEIQGTFDDCQHLVKQAFLDKELKEELHLTSANSINMARLLPQSIYYFWAYAQLNAPRDLFISVPSGNYGNLTAGLIAKRMGLPITKFVAASNRNDIVPKYLFTGEFAPKPSVQTYSNAMDVGNPSNFARILDLYHEDWPMIQSNIDGFTLDDEQTLETMKACYQENRYLLDPHGAIGYAGLKDWLPEGMQGVFLETAHPAKFGDIIDMAGLKYELPDRLKESLVKEKNSVVLGKGFEEFTQWLRFE